MIQNDQFTSPESRFFFPGNKPLEHHSSFDAESVPRVEQLGMASAFIVAKSADDSEHAFSTNHSRPFLRQGDTVTAVGDLPKERWTFGGVVERSGDLDRQPLIGQVGKVAGIMTGVIIELADHYLPHLPQGAATDGTVFEETNSVFLPIGEPTPMIAKARSDWPLYYLRGFVSEAGTFVPAHPKFMDYSWAIDRIVANHLAQNRLEVALLGRDLGIDERNSQQYLAAFYPPIATYFDRFEQMTGQKYLGVREDPWDRLRGEGEFPYFTRKEWRLFEDLAKVATHFIGHAREDIPAADIRSIQRQLKKYSKEHTKALA